MSKWGMKYEGLCNGGPLHWKVLSHDHQTFVLMNAPSPDMVGEPCVICGEYRYDDILRLWEWHKHE